jgi:hypothetical protein
MHQVRDRHRQATLLRARVHRRCVLLRLTVDLGNICAHASHTHTHTHSHTHTHTHTPTHTHTHTHTHTGAHNAHVDTTLCLLAAARSCDDLKPKVSSSWRLSTSGCTRDHTSSTTRTASAAHSRTCTLLAGALLYVTGKNRGLRTSSLSLSRLTSLQLPTSLTMDDAYHEHVSITSSVFLLPTRHCVCAVR